MKTDPEMVDIGKLEHIRHSLAHLLAATVLKKFPDAKLGIGPTIENGFYYDFLLPQAIAPDDLKELEKKMRDLIRQNLVFEGKDVSETEAKKIFKDQPFKLELIKELVKSGETISIYETYPPGTRNPEPGTYFADLCRGGHVANAKEIPADGFMLDKIAGAYWRGNEKNPMLQRIYGLAFASKKELQEYLKLLEEAKKRDHKVLGKKMGLFTFASEIGPGFPLFMPRGNMIREELLKYITEVKKAHGYQFVWTPHLAKKALYVRSGHLGKYDAMFPPIDADGDELIVKPMNCPHHFQIYNAEPHSYKDLPFRIAENATVYRNEKSGELSGLFRVISITQDDTHHIVRHEQIAAEIDMILDITRAIYETFGFKNFHVEISTRDKENKEKYSGTDAMWDDAETALIDAAQRWGANYKVVEDEAAFYGPKIDIRVEDALGRDWQLATVQLDYNQPENFDMAYIDENGKKARPAVIHVAILGSIERFLGILIEHFSGAFPVWLAPMQTIILPVGDKFSGYAKQVQAELLAADIRSELSDATESLGKRIRKAEITKIPYIIVVGEREEKKKEINFRKRGIPDKNTAIKINDFIEMLKREIKERI
jgi:threonyl-tRNA synthetase